jgi:hypothetical protein
VQVTHLIAREGVKSEITTAGASPAESSTEDRYTFVSEEFFTKSAESGRLLPISHFRLANPVLAAESISIASSNAEDVKAFLKTLHRLQESGSLHVKELLFGAPVQPFPDELSSLTSIKSLQFKGNIVSLPAKFQLMTHLERLTVHRAKVRIAPTELPSSLIDLKLSPTAIPTVLGALTNLKSLSIDCKDDDHGLATHGLPAQLLDLPALDSLSLASWPGKSIRGLEKLTRLTKLEVVRSRHIRSFSEIRQLINLTSLDAEIGRVSETDLSMLSSLTNLKLVTPDLKDLSFLRSMTNLKSLDIWGSDPNNLLDLYSVEIEHLRANREIEKNYANRHAIRSLPCAADFRRSLSSEDGNTAEKALRNALLYVSIQGRSGESLLSFVNDSKPVPNEFVNDDEEGAYDSYDSNEDEDDDGNGEGKVSGPGPFQVVADLLNRHEKSLPSDLFVELMSKLKRDGDYPGEVVLSIARAICNRPDDEQMQIRFASLLASAEIHRREAFNQKFVPPIVNDCLRKLSGPVLVGFLSNCHYQPPMFRLITTALERTKDADFQTALRLATEFVNEALEDKRVDVAVELVAGLAELCDPHGPPELVKVISDAKATVSVYQRKDDLIAQLNAADFASLPAILLSMDGFPHKLMDILSGGILSASAAVLKSAKSGSLCDIDCLSRLICFLCAGRQYGQVGKILFLYASKDFTLIKQAWDKAQPAQAVRMNSLESLLLSRIVNAKIKQTSKTDPHNAMKWYQELANITDTEDIETSIVVNFLKANLGDWNVDKLEICLQLILKTPDDFRIPAEHQQKIGQKVAGDIAQCVSDRRIWPLLIRLVEQLHKLNLDGLPKERVLAQLIAVCAQSRDASHLLMIQKQLPADPNDVKWDLLAFNGACIFAIRREKEMMLQWIKRARQLGKPTSQFESDSDFDYFAEDPDFLKAIQE